MVSAFPREEDIFNNLFYATDFSVNKLNFLNQRVVVTINLCYTLYSVLYNTEEVSQIILNHQGIVQNIYSH